MKILLSYASEFDKGEGVHFSRVLRRMGHEVHEVNAASKGTGPAGRGPIPGYPVDTTAVDLVTEFGPMDLFLYIEPRGLIPRGLESSPFPTACVICDVHRNLRTRLLLARFFDQVFLYHRNYLHRFSEHGKANVHWFPYACDETVFRDLHLDRDLDIGFVGQLFEERSERHRIISELSKRYRVNEQRYYLQDEIPTIYSRARIVVNLPIGDDLNFRFFEALFCGALLITRRQRDGQEILFREGVHYVGFGTHKELLEKCDYYLRHETERSRIARRGYEEAIKNHTLESRLRRLLEIVGTGSNSTAPIRGATPNEAMMTYARFYERTGQIDAVLGLIPSASRKVALGLLLSSMRAIARRALLSLKR